MKTCNKVRRSFPPWAAVVGVTVCGTFDHPFKPTKWQIGSKPLMFDVY